MKFKAFYSLTARDYRKCQLLFLSYSQCKDNFVLAPFEDIRRPQGFNMDSEKGKKGTLVWNVLSLSWWKRVLFRNQSIDLQSKSIEWFLYDVSFRHERDKYEFHHRYSTVNLIDAIQNKGQGMNLSTMQALRFDGLSFGLSEAAVSFPVLLFLFLGWECGSLFGGWYMGLA